MADWIGVDMSNGTVRAAECCKVRKRITEFLLPCRACGLPIAEEQNTRQGPRRSYHRECEPHRERKPLPPRACRRCGEEFQPARDANVYCSRECRTGRRTQVSRTKRGCSVDGCERPHLALGLCRPHYKVQHEMHEAMCVTCGEPFKGYRATAKYCSEDCRALDYMGKPKPPRISMLPHDHPVMRQARLPAVWAPRCELPADHPVMRRQRMWVGGTCEWCGGSFIALIQTSHPYRYCSRTCSTDAARHRRGRFVIPRSRRLAIYERDQWTCQLCGDPVDAALDSSDQWGATLDHIVCQSWTDSPDHSDSNLRLAHRWCNSVRADERHYDASVLAA